MIETEFGLLIPRPRYPFSVNDTEVVMSEGFIFPTTGFVRLSSILAPNGPIPVSKSTWWAGIKAGRFPKGLKLGPRITVWRAQDILALIDEINRM